MHTNIPSSQELRELLAPLRTADLRRISQASGVPFGTLWKVRSGETENPGIETVRLFLAHLNVSEQKQAPALAQQAFAAINKQAA